MSHEEDSRSRARAYHHAMRREGAGDSSAGAILAAAERITGIARVPLRAGDPLLDGSHALLDPAVGLILYNQDVEPWRVLFYQAHEYAHLWLDGDQTCCSALDMETGHSTDADLDLIDRDQVDGYGPHERRERAANTFALEFLLPCDVLRRWFLADHLTATAIAARTGMPWSLVCQQLTQATLGPPDDDAEARTDAAPPAVRLDPSQEAAAKAPTGPFLLEAGPGTGKTRTLVQRIIFLLDQGIPPSALLVLTFSTKAADEVRDRVAVVMPEAAPRLWIGTFHAFGLELLRKYGSRLGLPPRPGVLDPTEALFFLERALPDLRLEHYENLYEPAVHLRDILAAIARAKDELVEPAAYTALAEAMRQAASSEQEQVVAARACEVAHVYTLYQERLQQAGLLDFGDLISRAVTLLRAHPDVRALVQRSYAQILVDEYQDVNRASTLLLREVAGTGTGLWAVGDARQAIYRFRGAEPGNMRLFSRDFPAATVRALESNYRSRPSIVRLVSELAARMGASTALPAPSWDSQRPGEEGLVVLEIAEDDRAEIEGLARTIREQHARGTAYRDQAVLCRSHTSLARLASGLRAVGIPIHDVGPLWEREEVRDMLALLSLVSENDGVGLLRVGRLDEYKVPGKDIQALLDLARRQGLSFPRALRLARQTDEISPLGQQGLALLAQHLGGVHDGSRAWSVVADYLFERSAYLRTLAGRAAAGSFGAYQQCLALYQFLTWVQHHDDLPAEDGADPKAVFLRYVRRLAVLGDDKGLRQAPPWGRGVDAVHLSTIHASKGLEFSVVYLPMLGQRYFPAPRQWHPCPPPYGMLPIEESDAHRDEEDALFFVAISRARDALYLSRAQRYGRQPSKASALLTSIADLLPRPPDGSPTWGACAAVRPEPSNAGPVPTMAPPSTSFDVDVLDQYLDCPRRYYYEHVRGLSGEGDMTPYARFQQCVRGVLDWLREQQAQGEVVEVDRARQHLAAAWERAAPWNSVAEPLYRRTAEKIITRSLETRDDIAEPTTVQEWQVALPHGRVAVRTDHLKVRDDGMTRSVMVRRVQTAGLARGEREKGVYALYHAALAQAYPDAERQIQATSLVSDDVQEIALSDAVVASRLQRYDEAIKGIVAEQFTPQRDDRRCPRCPHYFICPTGA